MALGGGRNGVTRPGDTVIGTGSTVEGVMEIESRLRIGSLSARKDRLSPTVSKWERPSSTVGSWPG